MSINVDFLFVEQQMQKLFQHQSANWTNSSSATLFAPPQPSVSSQSTMHTFTSGASPQPLPSFQSSMHTFTPYAFPQPWTSFSRPCATYQTSMHFSYSPSAPYQTSMHFSSNLSAPYQYTMHSTATPFPPPQSSMHSSATPFPPQLCHTFSTTLVQHVQLQSKCTPNPHRIIQSNCTTQLRQQSNSKTEEEKDAHIRDLECFQEYIQIHGGYQVCWESVINACSKKK